MGLPFGRLLGLVMAIGAAFHALPVEGVDPTNVRMQRVVKRFVAAQGDGSQVVTLGSWAEKGSNYNDVLTGGTSDHDMRFIPRPGSNEAEAVEQWKQARNQLRGYIIEEFGTQDANKILSKTNLYAPSQAMVGVEDLETAAARYAKHQTVPSLGDAKPVDAKRAELYAEGLYGEGAKGWKQVYEAKTGRVVYSHNGKVYSGVTDLVHGAEGYGRFTPKGMGETATQWMEHAVDELNKGDARALAKQLERVDRDLHKGRDLARMGSDSAYRQEIQSLVAELRRPGAKVEALSGRINQVMSRGRLEAAILKRMDDAGTAQRAVLKTILQSAELNGKAWKAIKKIAGKVPYGAIVDGLMVSAVYYSTADTAMNRSKVEALAKLVPDLAGVAPGLLVEVTDACLEEAKETGYVMVANRQNAMDLIAGIYTARGREQGFERTGKKYDITSIDQLVRTYCTRAKLEAFVMVRAQQAAARDAGEVTGEVDAKVAQGIYDKCFPYLLYHWREKRDEYRREYIRLLNRLRTTPLVLTYTPNPAVLPGEDEPLEILLKAEYVGADMVAVRNRMREILKILTVGGIYIDTDVTFSAKGLPGDAPMTFRVWARKAGTYTTRITISDVCGAAQLGDAGITEQRATRSVAVEIPVAPPAAAAPVVAGPTGRFRGDYTGRYARHASFPKNFNLNRKGWLDFRVTGTQVRGSHTGENGQSTLSGSYDPETKQLTASATTTLVGTEVYHLSGTYSEEAQRFTGTYTAVYTPHAGTNKYTESGTWSAAGKMVGGAPPPKKQ